MRILNISWKSTELHGKEAPKLFPLNLWIFSLIQRYPKLPSCPQISSIFQSFNFSLCHFLCFPLLPSFPHPICHIQQQTAHTCVKLQGHFSGGFQVDYTHIQYICHEPKSLSFKSEIICEKLLWGNVSTILQLQFDRVNTENHLSIVLGF